jgi:hypothetical protein
MERMQRDHVARRVQVAQFEGGDDVPVLLDDIADDLDLVGQRAISWAFPEASIVNMWKAWFASM